MSAVDALIERAVRETIASHPDLARGTAEARPKAWGQLAAQGVRAYREIVGRALREDERRAVWQALWRAAHGSALKR